jgi:hypothetical protein
MPNAIVLDTRPGAALAPQPFRAVGFKLIHELFFFCDCACDFEYTHFFSGNIQPCTMRHSQAIKTQFICALGFVDDVTCRQDDIFAIPIAKIGFFD